MRQVYRFLVSEVSEMKRAWFENLAWFESIVVAVLVVAFLIHRWAKGAALNEIRTFLQIT
jgi:hypothetical protein